MPEVGIGEGQKIACGRDQAAGRIEHPGGERRHRRHLVVVSGHWRTRQLAGQAGGRHPEWRQEPLAQKGIVGLPRPLAQRFAQDGDPDV